MCFGDVHYSYTDRSIGRYRRRKQIKRFEEEKEMEELLNLATKQLFQLQQIAPEVMGALVEYYSYEISVGIAASWAILITCLVGVVAGLVWNYFDNWCWDVGPGLLVMLGGVVAIISMAFLIDFHLQEELFKKAPEVFVLMQLVGSN